MDDCTITWSKHELIDELKTCIKEFVEITDMGELHWLLGIKVKRDQEACTISLSQHSYTDSIFCHFSFKDLKPITTPMDPNVKLSTAQSPSTSAQYAAMQNIPYCKAVGVLMYMMLGTHPDVSYAVTMVSKFLSNPGMAHWDAVKQIYHYLLSLKDLWLMYGGDEGVSRVCWCGWQHGQRPMHYIWLHIHCWWWCSILEHQMPGDRLIVYNWEWIYCYYSHCKGSDPALFFDYASLQPSHSSHYSALRQPVCNHTHKGPQIPPMHQTHWCSIPFHLLGCQRWQNSSYILSNWWDGGRYPH